MNRHPRIGRILALLLLALPGGFATLTARAVGWEPDDIRVDSFVKVKWGQYTHDDTTSGTPCYNSKTPNGARSGCVATAFGMALRYWRWPETYDWSLMPFNTLSGVTTEQAEAIGQLLWDVGRWSGADYPTAAELKADPDAATYIYVRNVYQTLMRPVGDAKGGFGYEEALYVDYALATGATAKQELEALKKIVIPNCDYGAPVIISIDPNGSDEYHRNRHEILIDGYGYSNGVFCVHARCGGYGVDDGWFVPPNFDIVGKKFRLIKEATFNILPNGTGTIVSGRVFDPYGNPVKGADVSLEDAADQLLQTKSKANGVYAFLVTNAGPCQITANYGIGTAQLATNVVKNFSSSAPGSFWKVGNTYGLDLALAEPEEDEEEEEEDSEFVVTRPRVTPAGGTCSGTVNVTLATPTDGATIRYTTDFSEPTEDSPAYSGPIPLSVTSAGGVRIVRAKAWKAGLETSDETVAVYKPDIPTVATPTVTVTGANGAAIAAKGGVYTFSGSATVALASATEGATLRYTLDGSEPTLRSPEYLEPLKVTDDALITVKAWKNRLYASEIAAFAIAYDEKATTMRGDEAATAVTIEGTEGEKVLESVCLYTLTEPERLGNNVPYYDANGNFTGNFWDYDEYVDDPDQKYHSHTTLYTNGYNHTYAKPGEYIMGRSLKVIYHTAWFSWKAPASGRVSFSLSCGSTHSTTNLPVYAAVYTGTDDAVSYDNRLLVSAKSDAAYNFIALDAVAGETYRIVASIPYDLNLARSQDPKNPNWIWNTEKQDWFAWDVDSTYYTLTWTMDDVEAEPEGQLMDLSSATVVLSNYVHGYTGKAWYPRIAQVVSDGTALRPYVDYTYIYRHNREIGTGEIVLSGCGDYEGSASERFAITRRRITERMIGKIRDTPATGQPVEPEVTVTIAKNTLAEGVDYTVSYSNNVEVGTAAAYVTGTGSNFYGTAVREFEVVGCPVGVVGEAFGPSEVSLMGVTSAAFVGAAKVEALGLPNGLKLTGTDEHAVISGTPTEAIDSVTRRAYLLVTTVAKIQRLIPLKFIITGEEPFVETTVDASSLRYNEAAAHYVVRTGVAIDCPVTVATETAVKVTAKGLPKGLSLVEEKDGTRAIRGVATAAGINFITLTATAGKDVVSVGTFALAVADLPAWTLGTFVGTFGGGSLSVTVAAGGKITAKAVRDGVSLSYAATGFASDKTEDAFVIRGALAPAKGEAQPFVAELRRYTGYFNDVAFTNAVLTGGNAVAYLSPWKDKRLLAALGAYIGTYTHKTAAGETLTLTVDAKGGVKLAGTVGKSKLSLSATIDLSEDGEMSAFFYDAKSGFSQRLRLVPETKPKDVTDYGDNAYRDGAVSYEIGAVEGCTGSGTVTLVPATGQVAAGKTVTLTAKANKGSTFVKWVYADAAGNEVTSANAKLVLTATGDNIVARAVFLDTTYIVAPAIDLSEVPALRVGVLVDATIRAVHPTGGDADLVGPVAFTAVNLPAGLKLDKTTGRLTGAASKAVAAKDKKPFKVTATSTVDKTKTATATVAETVEGLPEWAIGTFAGEYGAAGSFTLTAAAAKLSGKVVTGGTTWTYAASGYAAETNGAAGFVLGGNLTLQKQTQPFAAVVTNWVGDFRGVAFTNATLVGEDAFAYRNPWKDKRLLAALDAVAGAYTHKTAAGETLTLTVDAKGTVKLAGTVGKTKLALSAAVDLDEAGDMSAYFCDAKTGFARRLNLVAEHAAPEDYGANAYRDAAVTYEIGAVEGCTGSGTVTLNPKFGQAATGKAVTLTAKANKGSTFVKWVYTDAQGEDVTSANAKLVITATGEDVVARAVFLDTTYIVAPALDISEIPALRVGVAVDATVRATHPTPGGDADLVGPVTFTAKNLPAGLKLDKTTGRLTGVPSKAVKPTDKKPFTITATSTVDKKKTTTATVTDTVAELPAWAVGTYAGRFGEKGSMALTVAATGKLSGKVAEGGTNWTYAATGFVGEEEGPAFLLGGDLTSGKVKRPFAATITNYVAEVRGTTITNAVLVGADALAYRAPWAEKALANMLKLKGLVGTYAAEIKNAPVTLSLDAKGVVKLAGTLADGRKVSLSLTLLPVEDGTLWVYFYLTADTKKGLEELGGFLALPTP